MLSFIAIKPFTSGLKNEEVVVAFLFNDVAGLATSRISKEEGDEGRLWAHGIDEVEFERLESSGVSNKSLRLGFNQESESSSLDEITSGLEVRSMTLLGL